MTIIKPMLAAPLKKGIINNWHDWVAQVKEDGHRLIIHVGYGCAVEAFTRPRGKDKVMARRELPDHLLKELSRLPRGIYDGEDKAGDTATDVKRTDLAHTRNIVLFDLLKLDDTSVMSFGHDVRRAMLATAMAGTRGLSHVFLVAQRDLACEKDVLTWVKMIWKTGGEGVILKRRASVYHAGKRSTDWLKIKKAEHFTLTVVGFEATRGTVLNRGRFAIVKLRDDEGNETTCKTGDDEELRAFEQAVGFKWVDGDPHPAIGRKLVIECGGRTRTGGYKGPVVWDRWEDE